MTIQSPDQPPSPSPSLETVETISYRGTLVQIPKSISLEKAAALPDLASLKPVLSDCRANLTDALCWQRTLEHEMEIVRAEIRQWSELQTTLIIREAELTGKIQVLAAPRHTPTDLTPFATRYYSPAELEAKELKKAQKTLAALSPDELEGFIQDLMSTSKSTKEAK